MFDYFYRGDKARDTTKGGAGLGLAMVKKIAELHNGRVTVESVVGQGSIFRVRFPASKERSQVP
ncbi:MAG: HAMP domain-containing histidine kinase [Anaerolineaceae bacterium]|nr:HAMP domain-containing histidine kinase [Anaerolineaceae bacterium]